VATHVSEEELQAVGRAHHRLGVRRDRGGLLGALGLGLTYVEADRLELARELLHLVLGQVVLEGERLELGLRDEAALLGSLDDRAGPFALQ
jgi:hypothetical protein